LAVFHDDPAFLVRDVLTFLVGAVVAAVVAVVAAQAVFVRMLRSATTR
jgi:hypothetical protein